MANEILRALRYGIDQPTENVATTLEALGFDTQAKAARELIDAPEDYESYAAKFINEGGEGFDFSALPLATVEQAGQLGGSILSRLAGAGIGSIAGPGGALAGAFLGPGLFEAVQIAGPVALERARNNGRTEPNWEDWSGALSTSAFSGVLNAVGVQGIGRLNSVARTAAGGVQEGVTEGLQGLTEQVGSTGLTEAGLQIDPKQVLGEAILGTSAGTSVQAPIAATQAAPQAIEKIKDLLPTQRPTTAPMAVRGMQDTTDPERIERRREAEAITQANQEFENRAPEIDPEQPSAQITDQEVQDTFLETHDEIINQFILQDFGEVDRAVRNAGFLDVQDNIRAHFELFDPRYPENSPMTVNQRIREEVQEAIKARIQAADTDRVVNQEKDLRFDFEAVPLKPQADVYSTEKRQMALGPPQRIAKPSPNGIASIETGIDPTFLSTTNLVPFLTNLPNKPMSAEQAMNTIGIKEDGNWFKASKSDKAVTDRVREAVDSGIASFLKDRKNSGEPVTKQEIENLFYDHLGRFETIDTYGEGTHHQGGHKFGDLQTLFNVGQEVELWTMYDARLPAGETKDSSPYYNRMEDSTHNPHGKGTNFWIRATEVENKDTGNTGLVLDEIQSQVHSEGGDPDKPGVYLSKVSREQESDLEPIRQKIKNFDAASRRFREEVDTAFYAPNLFTSDVANVLKGDTAKAPSVLAKAISETSPDFKQKYENLVYNRNNRTAEVFADNLYEEQPFAEFGYPLDRSFMYTLGTLSRSPEAVEKDMYDRLEEQGFDARVMSLTDSDVAFAVEDVKRNMKLAVSDVRDIPEFADKEQSLIKEYIPTMASRYPSMNEFLVAGANYPSETDQQRLRDFEDTRYETPTVPDYPFRKNWPGMAVRTAINNALANGHQDIYLPSKGFRGAPPTVYKNAQKAARKIAEEISKLTGDDVNDIYSMVPDSKNADGGPYFRLDITGLRQAINSGDFTGFKGYKEGGLVMNYGDYGRSYI